MILNVIEMEKEERKTPPFKPVQTTCPKLFNSTNNRSEERKKERKTERKKERKKKDRRKEEKKMTKIIPYYSYISQ